MDLDEISVWRRERMQALADKLAGNAALGRALGYKDGAFVGQMLSGAKPITEKTIAKAESLPGCAGWFTRQKGTRIAAPVDLDNHPDLTRIRRVRLKLSAGVSGFAVDADEEDGPPIFFRADWLALRGLKPYDLLALKVSGRSMEPSLYDGDLVVINTADTAPKDGEVFAVNYEGESVIKRLSRDAGEWWLTSDNPDKQHFPHKRWADKASSLVGRVIHKQSERI